MARLSLRADGVNIHLETVTECEQIGEHDGELSLRADDVNTHLETVTNCEQIGEHDGSLSQSWRCEHSPGSCY